MNIESKILIHKSDSLRRMSYYSSIFHIIPNKDDILFLDSFSEFKFNSFIKRAYDQFFLHPRYYSIFDDEFIGNDDI